jgi:hypothetical protein
MSRNETIRYAFFDGDNIGNAIDNLLNSGRIQEATHLSESIKYAVSQIERFIGSSDGAALIIAGGDDVLIKYDPDRYKIGFLENISGIFEKYTGLSMSCGVGNNVSQAVSSLMNVKQQNKGSISNVDESTQSYHHRNKQTRLYIFRE